MAAPVGNKNAAKSRAFHDAMRRAAAADDWVALRRIADKTLELAQAGEAWAVTMVRDTLDGKPREYVEMEIVRNAAELSDAELADIALRGSARAAEAQGSPEQSPSVH